jgi:anti-sigma-K factor RskA
MRYANPQLQTLLAAEYVLGTLRGRARRRFERLRATLPALAREQAYWETRLAALGLKLAPQVPPVELWRRIERLTQPVPESRPALWDRIGFWQGVALAASLAAIAMGILLRQLPAPGAPDYVGIVQAKDSQALWVVQADLQRGELRCRSAGGAYPVPSGHDLELWLLVKDEAAPISLGVLPQQGEMVMPLKPDLAAKLARAAALAVSLEPAGGSPTGAPTGPVLFTAPPPLST